MYRRKHTFMICEKIPAKIWHPTRGGGLGSRPKKMYGERLGDGVEYIFWGLDPSPPPLKQAMAFAVSFHLNLHSQSDGSVFNGTE